MIFCAAVKFSNPTEFPPDLLDAINTRAAFFTDIAAAEFAQEMSGILSDYISGDTNLANARLSLQDALEAIGEDGLATDGRVDLMLNTNADVAYGYGWFMDGQKPAVLEQWPAQELVRAYPRKQPRDEGPLPWADRWEQVGADLVDGRMVALKDDDVWTQLGNSFDDSLGNPFPPFAFNSGMNVKDIDHDEAVALGVMKEDDPAPEPQDVGLNDNLSVSNSIDNEELRTALEEQGYLFKGGDILVG